MSHFSTFYILKTYFSNLHFNSYIPEDLNKLHLPESRGNGALNLQKVYPWTKMIVASKF